MGGSRNVRDRLAGHERAPDWTRNCTGTLYYAACYTPDIEEVGRREIELRIQALERPFAGSGSLPGLPLERIAGGHKHHSPTPPQVRLQPRVRGP